MRDSAQQLVEQDVPKKNINASKMVPIIDWDEKVVWAFVKQTGGGVIGPVEIPHDKVSSYAGKLTWLAQEAWYYGKIDPTTHKGYQDVLPVTWVPGEPFPKEVPTKPPVTWAVLVAYQPLAAAPEEVEIANKVKPQAASPESEGSLPVAPGELEDTKKSDESGFPRWRVKATGELLSLLPGDKLAFWSSTEGMYHYARKTGSGWEIDFSVPSVSPEELDVKKVVSAEVLPKGFVLPPGYSVVGAAGGVVIAKSPKGTAVKWMEKTQGWSYMDEPWKDHNPGEESIDHAKKAISEPKPQTVATTPSIPEPAALPAVPPQTATQPTPPTPVQQPKMPLPKGFELPKGYSLTSTTPKAVFAKTPGGVAVKWVVKLRSWWYVDQPGKEHRPGEDGTGAVVAASVQSAPPPPPPQVPATPPPPPEAVKPPEPPKPAPFVIPAGAPANPKGFQISGPPDNLGLWPLERTDGEYDDGHWYVHQDGTVYHHSPVIHDYSPAVCGTLGWGLNTMEVPVPGSYFAMKKFYGAAPKVPEGFVKYGYDQHGLLLITKGDVLVVLLPNGLRATWQEKAQAYKLEDGTYLKVSDIKAGNFGTKKREVVVAENPEEPPPWIVYVGETDANGLPVVDEHSDDSEDDELATGLTLLPDERVAKWIPMKGYLVYKYKELTQEFLIDKKTPPISAEAATELLKTLNLTVKDGRYHKVLDSHKVYDPAFPAGFEPVTPVEGEVGLVPVRQVETNKRFYMLPGDLVASDTTGELKRFNVFGISANGLVPKEEYVGLSLVQVIMMTKGLDPTAPMHTQLLPKTDKNGYPMVRTRPNDSDSADELTLLPNGAVAGWDKNKKKYVVWEWDNEFQDFTPDVTHSYSLKQVMALQAKKLPGMPKAVSAVKPSQAVAKKPDPSPAPDYATEDTQNLDENGYPVHKHLLTGKLFSFLPTSQPTLGIWMSQMQAYRMVDWDPAAKSYTIAWKDEEAIWYLPGEPDVYVGPLETGGKKKVAKNPPSAELTPAAEKDPNGYEQGFYKPGGPASLEKPVGPYSHLPNKQLGKWDPNQHLYQLVAFNADASQYVSIPDPDKGGLPKTFIPPGKMSTTGSLPLGIFLPGFLPEEWDKLNVSVHKDENGIPAVMLPNGMLVQVPIPAEKDEVQFLTKTVKGFVPGETLTKAELVKFLKTIPLAAASSLHPTGKADPHQMPIFEPTLQPGVSLSLLPTGKYAVWNADWEHYTVWSVDSKGTWFQAKPQTTYSTAVALGDGYLDHGDQLKAFKAGKKEEDESKLNDVPETDINGLKMVKTPSGAVFSMLPTGKVLKWEDGPTQYKVYVFAPSIKKWVPKVPAEILYGSEAAQIAKAPDPSKTEYQNKNDANGFPVYYGVDVNDIFALLPNNHFARFNHTEHTYTVVIWTGKQWVEDSSKTYTVDEAKALGKTTPETPPAKEPEAGPPDPQKPNGFDQVEDLDAVDKNGLPVFMTKQGLKLSWLPNGQFAVWAATAKRYSVRELLDDTWLPKHPILKYTLDEVMLMVDAHGPFKPGGPKAMYKGTTNPIPFLGHFDDLGLPAYESGDVEIDMHRLPDGTWVLWDDDAGKYYKIEQNPSGSWAMVYPDVIFYKKDVMDMISKEAVKKAPAAPTKPQIVSVTPAALSPSHPDILPDPNGPDSNGIKTYIHKDQQASKFAIPVVWHPGKKAFYSLVGKSYVLLKWLKGAQKGDWNFYFDEDLTPEEMKAATADPAAPPAGSMPPKSGGSPILTPPQKPPATPPGLPADLEPLLFGDGEPMQSKHGLPYYIHKKNPSEQVVMTPSGEFYQEMPSANDINAAPDDMAYIPVAWQADGKWGSLPQKPILTNKQFADLVMGKAPESPETPSASASGASKPGPEYMPYSGGEDENGFPRFVRADADPDAPYPVTLLPNGEFARWLGLSKLYQVMRWDTIPPPSWEKVYKASGANAVYTLSEVEAMESGKPTPSTAPSLGDLVKTDKTDKNGLTYYQDKNHPSFKLSMLPDGQTMGHWVNKKQSYQKMALQDDGSWESAISPITFITLSDVEAMKIAMGHIASATPPSTPLTPSAPAPDVPHPSLSLTGKNDVNGYPKVQTNLGDVYSLLPDGQVAWWLPSGKQYKVFEFFTDPSLGPGAGAWMAKDPLTYLTLDQVKATGSGAAAPSASKLSPAHPDIENSGEVEDDFMLYHHKLNPSEKVAWVAGKFYFKSAKTYHEAEWDSKTNEWGFMSHVASLTPGEMKALAAAETPGGTPAFDPLSSIMGLHPSLKALLTKDDNGYDQAEVIAEPGKKLTVLPNGQMAKWSLSAQKYFKMEFDEADKFWSTADPPQKWTLDQVQAMGSSSSAPVSDDSPGQEPADAVVDTNFDWNPVPGIPDLKDLTYVGDGQALGYAGMGKKDIFEDPNTKQRFIFKPAIPKGGSKTELFRARIQEAYSAFAVKVRPDHIPIKTVSYNGQVGTLQPELKVKTNTLKGVKPKSLTVQQREQLSVEHVIDWVMSQHDTHGDNVIITDDGRLLTIDKEQGFRYIFDKHQPDRLSTDYQPNDTTFTPYYNIFWKAFEKGEFDLDMKAMAGAVAKVMSVDSQEYVKLITPYAESVWPNDPKKQDQFKKRALKRKLSARSDFEEFLTKIYTKREGEPGKFTFESGWVSDKKAHETMYVTKTLQGPSFVSWAESEHHISVYPYKDPTTNSPPPTPQDKIILKMPSGMPKEKLLDFLSEMGLEPLPEYPSGPKSPTPTLYSGSEHHKVIVKKSAWEALSVTKTMPIHPGAIPPTPETPSYWSGVEDLPSAPPNVEVLKSVHEKTDMGPGGVRVTFDGGKVEGHHGRVKRYKDSKGVYYLKHFKLRDRVWQELDAVLLAQTGADKKWVKEDFTFYQAPYDKASDCLVENGIEIDSTPAKLFTFPEGEVYFISDTYKYTYTGSLYIKVRKPGPLFDSIKSILNKIQPGLGTELLKPPTAEETEQRKLLQVIWSFDPKRHDQLKNNVPDLVTLRAEAKKAAKKGGFSANDLDRIEEREVYQNRNALVLPGRWKQLAKGRLWFLLQRAKSVDAVVKVAKQGLAGIHERNMSGIEQFGSSYDSDVRSGSGDQTLLFCVPECSESVNSIGSGYGEYWFLVHPDALDRLDAYFYPTDGWGVCKEGYTGSGADWTKRKSLEENFDTHLSTGFSYNEVMLRTGVSIDKVLRFAAGSESLRKAMIEALKDAGIPTVNGIPVEDFVVRLGSAKACFETYVKPVVV
jgi:hypothetical protein